MSQNQNANTNPNHSNSDQLLNFLAMVQAQQHQNHVMCQENQLIQFIEIQEDSSFFERLQFMQRQDMRQAANVIVIEDELVIESDPEPAIEIESDPEPAIEIESDPELEQESIHEQDLRFSEEQGAIQIADDQDPNHASEQNLDSQAPSGSEENDSDKLSFSQNPFDQELSSINSHLFDQLAVEVSQQQDAIEDQAGSESEELERGDQIQDEPLSGSFQDYNGAYEQNSFMNDDDSQSNYSEFSQPKQKRIRKLVKVSEKNKKKSKKSKRSKKD